LVDPITPDDLRKLETNFLSEQKLVKAFEKYQASHQTLNSIANISLGGLSDQLRLEFPQLCNKMLGDRIGHGLTIDDVLMLLRAHRLDVHMRMYPRQVTLQLVSEDEELRGSYFIYRRYETFNF
jgi:hypothetical protein